MVIRRWRATGQPPHDPGRIADLDRRGKSARPGSQAARLPVRRADDVYTFMQAAGLADDHVVTCFRRTGFRRTGRPSGDD